MIYAAAYFAWSRRAVRWAFAQASASDPAPVVSGIATGSFIRGA
jgi:hypothetical protein